MITDCADAITIPNQTADTLIKLGCEAITLSYGLNRNICSMQWYVKY